MLHLIRNLFTKHPTVLLGRWEHRISNKKESIKSTWANFDNCGDIICSKPTEVKKIIKQEKVKFKDK